MRSRGPSREGLARKPLIEGTRYSESQQVSCLNNRSTNRKSVGQDGSETVMLASSQLLPLEAVLYDPRTVSGNRRLTDRIGCTRLAGSTMA